MRVRLTPWFCDLFQATLTNLYDATGTEQGAFSQNELSFSTEISFKIYIPLLTVSFYQQLCMAHRCHLKSQQSVHVCMMVLYKPQPQCTFVPSQNKSQSFLHSCMWFLKTRARMVQSQFPHHSAKMETKWLLMQHSSISDTVYVLAWVK